MKKIQSGIVLALFFLFSYRAPAWAQVASPGEKVPSPSAKPGAASSRQKARPSASPSPVEKEHSAPASPEIQGLSFKDLLGQYVSASDSLRPILKEELKKRLDTTLSVLREREALVGSQIQDPDLAHRLDQLIQEATCIGIQNLYPLFSRLCEHHEAIITWMISNLPRPFLDLFHRVVERSYLVHHLKDMQDFLTKVSVLKDNLPTMIDPQTALEGQILKFSMDQCDVQCLPFVEEIIRSATDPVIPYLGFELMMRMKTPDSVDFIRSYLSNADPSLRAEAVEALGVLGDPQSIPTLVHLFAQDKNPLVRLKALGALQELHATSSASSFLPLLGRSDPDTDGLLLDHFFKLNAYGKLLQHPKLLNTLWALPDTPLLIRLTMVVTLAGGTASLPQIRRHAASAKVRELQSLSLLALGFLNDTRSLSLLLKILRSAQNPFSIYGTLKDNALRALWYMKNPEAIHTLLTSNPDRQIPWTLERRCRMNFLAFYMTGNLAFPSLERLRDNEVCPYGSVLRLFHGVSSSPGKQRIMDIFKTLPVPELKDPNTTYPGCTHPPEPAHPSHVEESFLTIPPEGPYAYLLLNRFLDPALYQTVLQKAPLPPLMESGTLLSFVQDLKKNVDWRVTLSPDILDMIQNKWVHFVFPPQATLEDFLLRLSEYYQVGFKMEGSKKKGGPEKLTLHILTFDQAKEQLLQALLNKVGKQETGRK